MELIGRKFIARINLPENTESGIVIPFTDFRKKEDKADVLVGEVEDVGPGCQWVVRGQKVAFLRFDYGTQSADVGKNRLIVDEEKDVLILGEDKAAPGIVAVNIIEEDDKNIIVPEWVKMNNELPVLLGQVIASGWKCTSECFKMCRKEHVAVGDIVFFRRLPDQQYRLGEHTIIFSNVCRHCKDHARIDRAADIILAKMEEVVLPRMLEEELVA